MKARAAAFAAALALSGHVLLRPVWETDAGWHLALGRLLLRGIFPRTNALTWTVPAHPWYPTNWLYDLISAACEARFGLLGFQLFGLLLFAIALWAWAAALAEVDRDAVWLLPAGAIALVPRLSQRPFLATFAALAIVLALCVRGRGKSPRYRWLCALVIAIAGNLHAGAAFAAGVAGLYCLEEFWRTRKVAELLAAAGCGLAIAANPGILDVPRYLAANLEVQGILAIKEMLPAAPRSEVAFFAALPLIALAAVRYRKEAGPALIASFVVLAVLGVRNRRITFDATVVGLALLAYAAPEAKRRLGSRGAALGAVLLASACALGVGYQDWIVSFQMRPRWNPEHLPVRAAEFVRAHGLDGKHFNALRDGGYLEAALPGLPAFADGRIQAYPEWFWRDFQAAEKSGKSFRAWLVSLGAEWAIACRLPQRLAGFRLLDAPDWALVHWDPVNEIWLHRTPRFDSLIAQYEYRYFRPYGSIVGSVEKTPRAGLPAFEAEVERFLRVAPADPLALLVKCALAVRGGKPGAAALCDQVEATGDEAALKLLPRARSLRGNE